MLLHALNHYKLNRFPFIDINSNCNDINTKTATKNMYLGSITVINISDNTNGIASK